MTDFSKLSSQPELLRQQLQQLAAQMRQAGLWSAQSPSAEALASTMPFMYDTLQVEEWLQWVFVPRMQALLDAEAALPGNCHVHALAEHEWAQRRQSAQLLPVLQLLEQIDANLNAGQPGGQH